MEAGLMKVVWCLNRSWTLDSYFSLQLYSPRYNWSPERNVRI